MTYDYFDAMRDDIKNYIESEISENQYFDRDDMETELNDVLFTEDSVTGNASGSYTFNTYTAKEYVLDNTDLLKEAYDSFDNMDQLGIDFINDNWEYMDVTIRCYIMGSVLQEILNDMETDGSIDQYLEV